MLEDKKPTIINHAIEQSSVMKIFRTKPSMYMCKGLPEALRNKGTWST